MSDYTGWDGHADLVNRFLDNAENGNREDAWRMVASLPAPLACSMTARIVAIAAERGMLVESIVAVFASREDAQP